MWVYFSSSYNLVDFYGKCRICLYQSHGFYGYWFTVSLMNGTFWVKVWYLPTETSFTDQWSRVFNNNIVPYLGGRIHQFDSTINQLLEHLVFLSNQIVFLFPLLLSLFSWRRITTPSRPSSVWQWPTNSWQMWKCYGRPVKTHFWSLLWGSFGSRSNLGYTVVLQFNVRIDTRNESLPWDDLVSFGWIHKMWILF